MNKETLKEKRINLLLVCALLTELGFEDVVKEYDKLENSMLKGK